MHNNPKQGTHLFKPAVSSGNSFAQPLPAHVQRTLAVVTYITFISFPANVTHKLKDKMSLYYYQ